MTIRPSITAVRWAAGSVCVCGGGTGKSRSGWKWRSGFGVSGCCNGDSESGFGLVGVLLIFALLCVEVVVELDGKHRTDKYS